MTGAAPCRVLMVTGAYQPEISSGGEQCRAVAAQLRGRAQVHVLTTSVDRGLPRYDVVDGVPVTRIRVDVRSTLSRLRAMLRMTVELLRLVSRADVVHVHGFSTKNIPVTFISRTLRKPVVMSLHTSGYDEPAAIERLGSVAWWSFLSVDRYLSVSPALVAAYLDAGLPSERVALVPNGIDIDRFTPAAAADKPGLREGLGLRADRPLIVFVGFFSADKQPRVLFDAWLGLQRAGRVDATVAFVGATESDYFEVDSSIAPSMQAAAAAAGLGDRLHFAGVTRDVPAYLRAADIFVLPSRREGLPVALLEAMACGLACVASRLSGATDSIITDGVDGMLVPVGDIDAVADAIGALLDDPAQRMRLGTAARSTVVERYASAAVAERWLNAYQRVAGAASC